MNAFRVGDALIDIAAPAHLREEISGDLRERFHQTQSKHGSGAASTSYWRDVAASLCPLFFLKIVSEFKAQWQSSIVLGGGAAVVTYLFIWVAFTLHFASPGLDLAALSVVVLTFTLAFKQPRIGATVAFVVGVFIVEIIDLSLTPSARHYLYGSAIYFEYLRMVALMFVATLVGLGVRGIFRRSPS